jgi:plastocyanin
MEAAAMLRLLFLLLRQRLPRRRALRPRYLVAVAACAVAVTAFLHAPANREAPATATATLRLRVDALESVPMVVFLESQGAPERGAAPRPARISSVNGAFEPAFQVASVGATIEVDNRDPIAHNTHLSDRRRTLFNVALPAAGARTQKMLTRPGLFDVRCDMHPWMRAWVFVPPDAHHAVLWRAGEVTLAGIEPGSYRLRMWQPAGGESTRALTLASGQTLSLAH